MKVVIDTNVIISVLIKEDILIPNPTSYGLHVSLNPRKRKEMEIYLP